MALVDSIFHSEFIFRPKKDLMNLFWAGVSRRVAISFLSFFSAIYIYDIYTSLGFDRKNAIYFVLIFYGLLIIFKATTYLLAENLTQKIGFKGSVRLSLIPFFLLILSLVLAGFYPSLVLLAGAFWGIHAGFFWWGYHGYFVKTGDTKKFGAGLGELEMLRNLAMIITPIAGALVIDILGFNYLFLLSAIFMSATVFLISKEKPLKQKHDVTIKEVLALMKRNKSTVSAYVAGGADGVVYAVAWSLFLYFFFGDVFGLGSIISVALLVSAVFGMFIGNTIDKQGERKVILAGTPLFSLSWFLRALSFTPSMFVIADSLRYFSDKMVGMPLMEITYRKAVEGYVAKAILFREIALSLGSAIAIFVIFGVVYLGITQAGIFVVMAVLSLLSLAPIIKRKI